ncbi:MAG: hypothetical protein ABSF90_31390 [Syntrophobacteraceae bacterium]
MNDKESASCPQLSHCRAIQEWRSEERCGGGPAHARWLAADSAERSTSRACACGRNPGRAGESPPLF